jgi:hypothetical protein
MTANVERRIRNPEKKYLHLRLDPGYLRWNKAKETSFLYANKSSFTHYFVPIFGIPIATFMFYHYSRVRGNPAVNF